MVAADPLFDCQRVEAIERMTGTLSTAIFLYPNTLSPCPSFPSISGKVVVSRRCQLKVYGNDACRTFNFLMIRDPNKVYKNATCSICSTDACNHSSETSKIWSTLIVSAFFFSVLYIIAA